MYNGIYEWNITDNELANFYEKNYDVEIPSLMINQYLFICDNSGKCIDKFKWDGSKLNKIKFKRIKDFKPKTNKQECCFDLLSDDDIKCKIIFGCAGSGKTKMALEYGFEYLKNEKVQKIFLLRHNVSIGEKNGYLKGTKEDKILGWLGCIKDNIEDRQESLEELIAFGKIDVEAVEYIKGRDIKNAWFIVDEAEDLTEEQFQMIGERVAEGSYVCFIGDLDQTSQKQYEKNNGLKRAIKNFAGDSLVGIIGLEDAEHDNVRSEISKLFTYKY